MKKQILILALLILPMVVSADNTEAKANENVPAGQTNVEDEGLQIIRGGCMPDVEQAEGTKRASGRLLLPTRKTLWDASRTYHQLVVLVNFADSVFKEAHTAEYYDNLFNNFSTDLYEGRKRYGAGSVADYFRDQSGGLLNMQFDIVGPYQVDAKARPTTSADYKSSVLHSATELMVADQSTRDFSPYDWDGDGKIEQVVFVLASLSGNVSGQAGFLHPNTSSFSTVETPDGYKISNYSATAELFTSSGITCGIGTICHEFTHNLGLPDIYQTSGNKDVIVDEWDLMDGGNFTNYGWCPPNYSALEKMLLGWLTPVELNEKTSISNMKSIAEGGEAYLIKHTDNEYFLLENRQQRSGKWDYGLPGKGLVVWHVNYNASRWSGNTVNTNSSELGFQLVHADNLDYSTSAAAASKHYANSLMMNSNYLSGSAYPYSGSEGDNTQLTDYSTPASIMYHENSAGSNMLDKDITNIQMTDDGLISFDFLNMEKCATPTITMENGKLKFGCQTEGVNFIHTVTPATASSYDDTEGLSLSCTYHVTVYATKEGYRNSDTYAQDVTMSVGMKCDVNGDGKVTIADAVKVVDSIMNDK